MQGFGRVLSASDGTGAERGGFEPPKGCDTLNGLANRHPPSRNTLTRQGVNPDISYASREAMHKRSPPRTRPAGRLVGPAAHTSPLTPNPGPPSQPRSMQAQPVSTAATGSRPVTRPQTARNTSWYG